MLKINDIEYNVGMATISRSIRVDEKYRVKTEDGIIHREIRAKYMDFMLTVGNFGQADYNALIAALRAVNEDVTVELSKNATEVEVYTGTFDTIADEIATDDGTEVTWDKLSLTFTGTIPLEV